QAPASVHEGAAELGAGARPRRRGFAQAHPAEGGDPFAGGPAARVPVPHALPDRAEDLLRGRTAPGDERERAVCRLSFRGAALTYERKPRWFPLIGRSAPPTGLLSFRYTVGTV